MWHPALYEHPVLPFRYKSGGNLGKLLASWIKPWKSLVTFWVSSDSAGPIEVVA